MARDSSGNYSLPAGNPVVTLTVISSAWANTTMSDLATAMTASLDRSGNGGMLAGLKLFSGAVGAPGLTWSSETTSGLYRSGAGDFRWVIGATELLQWTSNLEQISGTAPIRRFNETDAAANNRLWDFIVTGEQLAFRVLTDALVPTTWLLVDRTAGVVDSIGLSSTALTWNGSPLLSAGTAFANPTASVGLAAVNGAATTAMRSDAAPALSQAITPTWTNAHTFTATVSSGSGPIVLSSNTPGIVWRETDGAANNQYWRNFVEGEQLLFQISNDAFSVQTNWMVVDRTGTTVDSIALTATALTWNGTAMVNLASVPSWTGRHTFTGGDSSNSAVALTRGSNDVFISFTTQGVQDWSVGNRRSDGHLIFSSAGSLGSVVVDIFTSSVNIVTPLLQAQGIHNGTAPTGTNNYIASGTYSPTVTNGTNMSAGTASTALWIRVGRVVTVSGETGGTATGGGNMDWDLSLPIASNITGTSDLSGAGGGLSGQLLTGNNVIPLGNIANDRATLRAVAIGAGAFTANYMYQYIVS